MRGRLINPFLATIARLDTASTAAAASGVGFDEDFLEPKLVAPQSGSGRGTSTRQEITTVLPCQVVPEKEEEQRVSPSGATPQTRIRLLFHMRDLERASLVDAHGMPLLRVNDRLVDLRERHTGALVQEFPTGRELYATEIRSRGYGIGRKRNLVQATFEVRDRSVESVT